MFMITFHTACMSNLYHDSTMVSNPRNMHSNIKYPPDVNIITYSMSAIFFSRIIRTFVGKSTGRQGSKECNLTLGLKQATNTIATTQKPKEKKNTTEKQEEKQSQQGAYTMQQGKNMKLEGKKHCKQCCHNGYNKVTNAATMATTIKVYKNPQHVKICSESQGLISTLYKRFFIRLLPLAILANRT